MRITHRVQPDWGNSPARTKRKLGEIYYNERYLKRKDLNADDWNIYQEHEMGHIVLDTRDEFAADAYARSQYFPSGRSLRNSVRALLKVLNMNDPGHRERVMVQLKEAAKWDCEKNNSCTAAQMISGSEPANETKMYSSIEQGIQKALSYGEVTHQQGPSVTDGFDNVVGCGNRPVSTPCSGGPIKRRRCNDGNKLQLEAWNKCNDQNNQDKKREDELSTVRVQLDIDRERLNVEADSAKQILAQQQKADEELTKREGQSKTPQVLMVLGLVAGVALALYFLFGTGKPKTAA